MLGGSIVAVMQATESWECDDGAAIRRCRSPRWCLLRQAEVSSILVVVVYIVTQQPLQMAFVHRKDVVQQIAAATLDPSLGEAVLPRAFERGPDRPDLQRSNGCGNLDSILAIPVEDQEPRSRFERERFPQLLYDPQACRCFVTLKWRI
jgi:hypothetical protein